MGIISDVPVIAGMSRNIIYEDDKLAEWIPNHASGYPDDFRED
jgi:hypothetical protein